MTAHFVFRPSAAPFAIDRAPGRATHVIENDKEAIDLVRHLAASFRVGVIQCDCARRTRNNAIDSLVEAGFFGMTVPKAFGGAGVSAATVAESFRVLSAADAMVAQVSQNHFCWLPVAANGDPDQSTFFFKRFLEGDRLGYVHAEDVANGLCHPEHTIRRTRDGWRVSGRKYCSPGAASGRWLAFTAVFDRAGRHSAFVFLADAAAEGVTPAGRDGANGPSVVLLDDAFVPDFNVFPLHLSAAGGRAFQLNASLIHAAIALGIAEDALSGADAYIRDLGLPLLNAIDGEHVEQPFVLEEFVACRAMVRAAGVSLRDAARAVDQAGTWPSTGTVLNARLAVADAERLCSDAANRISDEFFLLADVSATLGHYGFERHRRNAHAHSLHDPRQWCEYHLGGGDHAANRLAGRGNP